MKEIEKKTRLLISNELGEDDAGGFNIQSIRVVFLKLRQIK